MGFTTQYRGRNSDRGPSGEIWADLDVTRFLTNPEEGVYFFDDFHNFGQHISDQNVQQYGSYIDTSCTIIAKSELDGTDYKPFGIARATSNNTDNDEMVLATYGALGNISATAGRSGPLWFEGRFRISSIADSVDAMFLGLAFDDGSGTVGPITNTLCLTDDGGELGAFSFLGFHIAQDDGNALQFTFKAEGQTAVVVSATVGAVVADTWYKVGFKYNPNYPTAKRIKIYVDGVEYASYYGTGTQIAAATFPDDEPLGLCWAFKQNATGGATTCDLDWWRFAQTH